MTTSPLETIRRSAAMSDSMPSAIVLQLLDELDRCHAEIARLRGEVERR